MTTPNDMVSAAFNVKHDPELFDQSKGIAVYGTNGEIIAAHFPMPSGWRKEMTPNDRVSILDTRYEMGEIPDHAESMTPLKFNDDIERGLKSKMMGYGSDGEIIAIDFPMPEPVLTFKHYEPVMIRHYGGASHARGGKQ